MKSTAECRCEFYHHIIDHFSCFAKWRHGREQEKRLNLCDIKLLLSVCHHASCRSQFAPITLNSHQI